MQQLFVKTIPPPSQDLGPKLPHKSKDLQRSDNGSMIMNERNLKIICQNEGLYEYPQMNTKLYLHFKVIQKIQNLDKYVNLKTIYLENNVITKIENLDCLVHLQNLFLQNNMIKKIQNLSKLKELRVLNLSNNNIFKIEGLSQLLHLQNLCMSNNYLTQFEDLQELGYCTTELTSIDLANNHIKPNPLLLNLIPQVKCLYLSGNPLVRETKHYRRVVVGTLKNLLYLDQRGIDKEERMLSEAWVQGGQPAFKEAKEKVQKHRQQVKEEKRQEIMKDIDVHRNRKINIFLNNIREAEEEIEKLRKYMNEKENEDMEYFYETKIAELYEKIRENQEFVNSINKRIGAAAKSVSTGGKSVEGETQKEKSVCSEGNNESEGETGGRTKSEGEKMVEGKDDEDDQDEEDYYEDQDDKMDEKQTDCLLLEENEQKNEEYQTQQMRKQVAMKDANPQRKTQQEHKQKHSSEPPKAEQLNKKNQEQKTLQKQSKPMTPAPCSGLDELD